MSDKRAAVFIMLGQSNATGHALPMREEDVIRTPLSNVFGLNRKENQSLELTKLTFTGWTSAGTNLGETQDDTYSVPNCLASLWQAEIDKGENLPDLYVVHISIGAQGVSKPYMWYPDYEKKLVPGPLGIADIALYPLTVRVLSLLRDCFSEMGVDPEIIGLHWRGGEEDIDIPVEQLTGTLYPIYERILTGFREAVGIDCPIILHRVICGERADDLDPSGGMRVSMYYVGEVFDSLARNFPDCTVFDHRTAPFYTEQPPKHGIFEDDHVHYTEKTNRWVAQRILDAYREGARL